uniref:3-isopropylmalate dehydrogenase n=1 Tax=Rhizophora mucronata TaxID=61149 RepID=A0A2P2MW05_RHIMU
MSPNILFVTIVSNCFGLRTSCMAALSTYMCESSTLGYSEAMAITLFLQNIDASKTLALSTEQSFPLRFLAVSNATRAIRSTSEAA